MHLALVIGLICIIVCIFCQDLRQRAVYLLLFPLLFVVSYFYVKNELTPFDWKVNGAFVLLQLLVLWVYFSIKEKRTINYINKYLGLGDILFFIVLVLWFTPVNFILFFVGSLIITLIGTIIFKPKSITSYKIPLAGIHALFLALVILLRESFFPDILTKNWILL